MLTGENTTDALNAEGNTNEKPSATDREDNTEALSSTEKTPDAPNAGDNTNDKPSATDNGDTPNDGDNSETQSSTADKEYNTEATVDAPKKNSEQVQNRFLCG